MEAFEEKPLTMSKVVKEFDHTQIIIQVYPDNVNQKDFYRDPEVPAIPLKG